MIHKYTTVNLCNVYTTVTERKAPATLAGAEGYSVESGDSSQRLPFQ